MPIDQGRVTLQIILTGEMCQDVLLALQQLQFNSHLEYSLDNRLVRELERTRDAILFQLR